MRSASNSLKDSGRMRPTASIKPSSNSSRGKGLSASYNGDASNSKNRSFSAKAFESAQKSTLHQSLDFNTIEAEYIRNLQQQVYFLELETEYLRDQARKNPAISLEVAAEADRSTQTLTSLHNELAQRDKLLAEAESKLQAFESEKSDWASSINELQESFAAEKRELVNEVVLLKKQVERSKLDSTRREEWIGGLKSEANQSLSSLRDAERRIEDFKVQLSERTEQYSQMRVLFEEKRAECLRLETELQELEERFFKSEATTKEMVGRELKEEIKQLRYDLRERELCSEQDRVLRQKISDDCTALVKENAALMSQVIDLQKHLDAERRFKEDKTVRRQMNIQEMVSLKEENKILNRELEKVKGQLHSEINSHKGLIEKLSTEEENHSRAKLQRSRLEAELRELEGIESAESQENVQLRRDKLLLTDEAADLRKKLAEKEDEVAALRADLSICKRTTRELEMKLQHISDMDAMNWEEFDKMAEHMKEFSRHLSPMRKTVTPVSARGRTADFDT